MDEDLTRNAVIKRIKTALEKRSGKKWSVTGGRGTAYGWLTIDAPPSERVWADDGLTPKPQFGYMSKARRQELASLLGLDGVHTQGVSIASSNDYYREYIDRAEGRTPAKVAQPYWD